jgi:hypothetical protein
LGKCDLTPALSFTGEGGSPLSREGVELGVRGHCHSASSQVAASRPGIGESRTATVISITTSDALAGLEMFSFIVCLPYL